MHMGSTAWAESVGHDRVEKLRDRAMPQHIRRNDRLEAEVDIDRVPLSGTDPPIDELKSLLVVCLDDVRNFLGRDGQAADGA